MATFSYDFSNKSDIIGQTPPEVEVGYEPNPDSIVISDARAFGDGTTTLRVWNGGGGATHSFARVTNPLPLVGGDCEIFGRCLARPDDSNPSPNNIADTLLAFGDAESPTSEFSWNRGFNFRARSYQGTTGGGLFDRNDEVVAGVQYASETWVEFLIKRTGDLIEIWHWEAGQAEPSTPQISYTENKHKDNEIRLTGRRSGSHWDFVGVGTEGDPAPRSADAPPEEITGSTTPPYTGLWTPSAAGIYRVTAKFTTVEGSTQESDPVDFEVQDPE